MSKNQLILNNTLALYIRLLLTLLISLYSTRILLENLGVNDFGLYGTVAGVIALIAFLQTALSNATNRFLNIEMAKGTISYIQNIFSTSVFLHIIIAIFICILIEIFGSWSLNSYIKIPLEKIEVATQVFHLSVISLFFLVITIPFEAMLMAKEKFGIYALISVIDVILKLILAYILIFFADNKLLYYAIGVFLIIAVMRLTYVLYVILNFVEARVKFYIERNFLKKIISFISWDLYGNFSLVLRVHGTTLLMNNFFGLAMVASIQISNQITAALHSLSSNILLVVKPQLMKSYAENNLSRTNELIIFSSKYAYYLMFVFCAPIIINIEYILNLWLVSPPKYTKVIVIFMLITSLIGVIFNPIIMLIHATGNVRKISFLTGSLILLSVPIIYIFFNFGFEYYYAYIVFTINSLLIGFLNMWIAKNLVTEFNTSKFMKDVLFNLAYTTLIIYFTLSALSDYLVVEGFWDFILFSIFQVVISVFFIYFLGVDKSHKEIMSRYLILKLRNRLRKN
ncbi:MATE family efflux transporter [Acinetobacter lwoffii]|uniref:hypothetical protein n=1 Tax=Acinetobacter lwoffii TaxID=28090 RepID=UPI0021CD6074|nr:hypothetical protein [Acinetobacter lwoffii]MCU4420507.1 hypothetical protein [Acinetobacter lwoffii]